MLAKLEMQVACEGDLNYQMSSLFHGALIELLDFEYAAMLHQSKLHPYTQHLEYRNNDWYWIVTALNEEAVEEIFHKSLFAINNIELKKKKLQVKITEKKYTELTYENLARRFYEEESSRYIQLQFVTPTAFKSYGEYIFHPEPRLIFQSLMKKYDGAAKDEGMIDNETLEQTCNHCKIVRYELKSLSFNLEGIKIPGFIGKITLKMSGAQTIADFANMLLNFGTYSGIGIKTSIGMGALKLLDEGRGKGERRSN